jgi:hypothetical protein
MWSLPQEAGRIASHEGLFAERQAPTSVVAAAKQEGWSAVLQAWYPGYCSGYGGWHQTWTSRQPVRGNATIGVARDCCGHLLADSWFFSVLIRVDGTDFNHQSHLLSQQQRNNARAHVRTCARACVRACVRACACAVLTLPCCVALPCTLII